MFIPPGEGKTLDTDSIGQIVNPAPHTKSWRNQAMLGRLSSTMDRKGWGLENVFWDEKILLIGTGNLFTNKKGDN